MQKNNNNNFSEKLLTIRKEKHLTQVELAKKLGVSQVAIHNWENGKRLPSLNKFNNICKVLNVSSEYFLGGKK